MTFKFSQNVLFVTKGKGGRLFFKEIGLVEFKKLAILYLW